MFSSRFIRITRLDRLPREETASDRAVALVFVGRFVDEVLSGAWTVLAPTFRVVFRLSLIQIGFLSQILGWVALAVEPVAAFQVDLRERRPIMAVGAVALAASVFLMGVSPDYAVLVLAFALYGVGSGPVVLTADVLVVESFPGAPERAYGRATFLDSLGALAGPGLVAFAALLGVSWRVLLVALAGCAALYAIGIGATRFPSPARGTRSGPGRTARLVATARTVLASPRARRWLLVLLCFDVFESAFVLKYIWLHDSVGLNQSLVAVYAAGEQIVNLVALALLDSWLVRRDAGWIFRAAAAALVVLPTAWVAAPGLIGRIVVGIPLSFATALIWPLAKGQQLTAIPELGGATQAITALFPILPLALVEAQLATIIGVGPAMAATATAGAVLMLAAIADRPLTSVG